MVDVWRRAHPILVRAKCVVRWPAVANARKKGRGWDTRELLRVAASDGVKGQGNGEVDGVESGQRGSGRTHEVIP